MKETESGKKKGPAPAASAKKKTSSASGAGKPPAQKKAAPKSAAPKSAAATKSGGAGSRQPRKTPSKPRRGAAEGLRAALISAVAVLASLVIALLFLGERAQRRPAERPSPTIRVVERDVPPAPESRPQPGEPVPQRPSVPAAVQPAASPSVENSPSGSASPEVPGSPSGDTSPAARGDPPPAIAPEAPTAVPELPARPEPKIVRPALVERPAPSKGSLVIVIDDAGNNLKELEGFLNFPGQLTLAVLPALPYSREAARRIRSSGKDVILHQPMEALGGQNPGPGAIYSDMDEAEIRAVLRQNLDEVGPVAGMNNHQGSKITMDERIMNIVLAFCEEEGLYFLDSRTTADTVVPRLAQNRGMRILERDVFLDNDQDREQILRALRGGIRKAESTGAAVMIGHTWSLELADTLHQLYPELIEEGWSLSSISRFMIEGLLERDLR